MRKHWIAWAGFAAAFGLFGCLVAWLLSPPRPGVTWANVARIQPEMTRGEVEVLFGRPPDWAEPLPDDQESLVWVGKET
jgi:hypothetical protein